MENLVRVSDNTFDRIQVRSGLTVKNNSQMSKMSELGLGLEAADREEAANRAKLEARIQGLAQLENDLTAVGHKLAEFGVRNRENQILLLGTALTDIDVIRNNAELPVGASRPLRTIRNAIVSIREGLTSGAYSKEERRALEIHEVLQARATVRTLKEKSQKRLEALGLNPVDAQTEELDASTAQILAQTALLKNSLLSIKNKPLVLTRAPIVPVTATRLDLAKLAAAGIRAENLGGYPLIHDQRIIGVNRDALQADARGNRERAIEAATRYMASLREAVAPLTMVSDKAEQKHAGSWYWVADRSTLRALREASGGNINVTDWGFGFGD